MSVHSGLVDVADRRFRRDVEKHELSILRDDGCYRHLRFRSPKSSEYWFDIITWPGHLTVRGDMGCYVFARCDDMFTWFGADRPINPMYWTQKLQAISRFEGVAEFNSKAVHETVLDHVKDWAAELNDVEAAALRGAVQSELLVDYETDESARSALEDFEVFGHRFSDVWEYDFETYTIHYLWCCHAITWAIGRYYDVKSQLRPEGVTHD